MTATIHVGDCRDVLATLPDQSVQTCVTSPPYFGLRDYGVDGQIGLESTVEAFVENLVDVFREVRRVLKDDGTLWMNLGDSYNSNTRWSGGSESAQAGNTKAIADTRRLGMLPGLKEKDLIGIPWRVAFALQQDGWYLRSDIIWSKPNPMPESVRDRCTKSHEYIFLLSKAPRYYYDAAAIAEPSAPDSMRASKHPPRSRWKGAKDGLYHFDENDATANESTHTDNPAIRNKRSVWTVATQPFSEAHFATFPPKLIEPCILAGSSEKGHCPECGQSWVRVVERVVPVDPGRSEGAKRYKAEGVEDHGHGERRLGAQYQAMLNANPPRTVGWQPQCTCGASPVPDVVLDPFAGAGTTGLVADRLNRDFIGIELNPEYAEIAKRRIYNDAPMFATVEVLA